MPEVVEGLIPEERKDVENVLRSSGFFYEFEIETALEIFDETISKGEAGSGYHWLKVREDDHLVAFANYGKNSFSVHSWDLYWIAVHKDFQNKKLGSLLLRSAENDVRKKGGRIIWIETSGRPLYTPTVEFYKRNGYELNAVLKDFYAPGDSKLVFSKVL
ncbi:MAG: GNAT family N-acetyltransferase [Bacteroidales bacterium]|nr:GNAT family N-acetyltransferase [Bacteroidales bacterium]